MVAKDSSQHEPDWPRVASHVTNRNDTYPFIDPTKADMSEKSVLITGASKGIGKATAISFAVAGCSKIALAARSDLAEVEKTAKDAAAKAKRPEPLVLCIHLDVTSEDSVRAALEVVNKTFGGSLDVLINNAGYLDEWHLLAESETAEWWRSWEVNMKGTYLCSRYFIPLLLESQTKTLLNIGSAGSHFVSPGASGYQTNKFAICRFNEFADAEYNDRGLISIALHPGCVKTELALHMPEFMHSYLVDTAELGGDTMVWLSSKRRNWLSGRFICVSWDMEELEKRKSEILERDTLKFRLVL